MEAVECGAASLAMVLAHYGKWVPLEELRLRCGVARDGLKATNILKAARSLGLEAGGLRRDPDKFHSLTLPVIVHWNFNHFVVVAEVREGSYLLLDPAFGPREVTSVEFDESFTGVVLKFAPGPDFEKGGAPPSVIDGLRRRLRGSRRALAFVVLAGLGLVVPGLAIPVFSRVFVDDILIAGRANWVRPLLVGMTLTAVLRAALCWLQQSYLLRLETKMAVASSGQFLWHLLRLPVAFFTQRYAGDLAVRVEANDRLARVVAGDLATSVLGLVTMGFYAAVMMTYHPRLTALALGFSALNVIALRRVAVKRRNANRRLRQHEGKMMGTALNGLSLIETLKASGSESDLFERWAGYQSQVLNGRQELERLSQIVGSAPKALAALNTAAILGFGGLAVMNGELTMGMLIAFQSLTASFMTPVSQLTAVGNKLQEVETDVNRLDDALRYRTEPGLALTESGDNTAAVAEFNEVASGAKLRGALTLRAVTFGYSRMEKPLIRDFELHIEPGSRVALVGGSGSGKSTVAKLVCGLYEPWEGDILFDGKPREEHPRALLTNSFALVDQSVVLFDDSVRHNLTLWDDTVPMASIIAAAKDACIHDEIAGRPGGYDSRVREDGANFSGGQRQRLELARALALEPSLVVLDEATSALDPVTEGQIDRQLRRRGLSCLIVAHRLSTIRDADEIIVMENGRVVERGCHDELKSSGHKYRELIDAE